MSAPSVTYKIASNVVISSVLKIVSILISLLAIGLTTRYLGPDKFGWYVTVLTFFAFFNAIGDWGLNQTTAREISLPNAEEQKIINLALGTRIFLSGIIFLVSLIIVTFLPYKQEIKIGLLIVLLAYIFYSFYQVLFGVFQKRIIMDKVVICEFLGKISQVVFIFLAIKFDWGFNFIVNSLLVSMFLNFILVYFLAKKFISFSPHFNWDFSKKYLKKSLPIGISVFVSFIYFKADTILLSLMKPAEDVGIYGTAYKIIETLSFFPGVVVGLTMPILAFNFMSDSNKFEKVANQNFKFFLVIIIPLIIGTVFLANRIIQIIAGNQFQESSNVLKIIIFALAFIFFGQLFSNILIAAKLQKYLMIVFIICAIFNVGTNLIFIPYYSYYATAFSSVFTELLVVFLELLIIHKKIKYLPKIEKIPQIILSSLSLIIFLFFFRKLPFLFLIIGSIIIYFSLLFLLKVFNKKELLMIIPPHWTIFRNKLPTDN